MDALLDGAGTSGRAAASPAPPPIPRTGQSATSPAPVGDPPGAASSSRKKKKRSKDKGKGTAATSGATAPASPAADGRAPSAATGSKTADGGPKTADPASKTASSGSKTVGTATETDAQTAAPVPGPKGTAAPDQKGTAARAPDQKGAAALPDNTDAGAPAAAPAAAVPAPDPKGTAAPAPRSTAAPDDEDDALVVVPETGGRVVAPPPPVESTPSEDPFDLDDIFGDHGARVAMPSDDDPVEDDEDAPGPAGGSSVEGAGHPGGDATTKVPALSRQGASFELPRSPLQDRGARMAFGDGGATDTGARGGALATSDDRSSRIPVRGGTDNDEPAGGSKLEGAGNPAAAGRMGVGEAPPAAPRGGSKLEGAGNPATAGRMGVSPDTAGAPDAAGGDLSLSQDRDERVPMDGVAPAASAPSPLSAYGSPSRDRSERVGAIAPDADDEGAPAGAARPLSTDRSERFGAPRLDSEGPAGAELALSRDRSERVRWRPVSRSPEGEGAPLALSRDRGDRMGRPAGLDAEGPVGADLALSRDRGDRMGRPPADDELPPAGALALSLDRGDRMGRPPADDELPPAAALALSRDRGDRMGRPPGESEGPAGAALALSRDRADRLLREPRMLEAEDLADIFAPSRDRGDRLGRPSGLFVSSDPQGDFSLSRDSALRMGSVPAFVDADPSIPDLNTAAFAEAGRMQHGDPGQSGARGPVPNGLEGLMPHRGMRGADRMRRPEDEPVDEAHEEADGRSPVPPRRVEVLGRARPDERTDEEGYEREMVREKTHRRLEFVFQRYEMLIVRRGIYRLKGVMGSPDYVTRDPVFLAGKVPIGNGMLAQTIAARFGDHATLVDVSNQLGRHNYEVDADRLAEAIEGAAPTGRAVLAAMTAAVEADDKRSIDKKGIATLRAGGRRRLRGELKAVTTDEHLLLVHAEAGEAPPSLLQPPGRSRAKGKVAWDLFLERIGWNRAGLWAGVRRRFTASLITHPQLAAYALFLIYAIDNARIVAPKELAPRCRALQDWLEARRSEFNEPENGLHYAILHALSMWERMAWVDAQGAPVDEPEMRPLPRGFEPTWEMDDDREVEQTAIWGSIVGSCRQLGIRPWEYLYDLFQAVAAERLDDPAQWTPAAWARTTRS